MFKSIIAFIFLVVFCSTANAASVTLAWDPSTNALGYKLYYGTQSGVYSYSLDVGDVIQRSLSNIATGVDLFFAVTAYDSTSESNFSKELECYTLVPLATVHGTITPNTPVVVSSDMTSYFTIVPDSGYQTSSILVDGSSIGTASSYTFSDVYTSHTISAIFEPIPTPPPPTTQYYYVTASSGTGGSIYPSGSIEIKSGTDKTFVISVNRGYTIDTIKVDGILVPNSYSYTFFNINSDHTISVTFRKSRTRPSRH